MEASGCGPLLSLVSGSGHGGEPRLSLAQAGSRLPRLGGRYPAGGVCPWSARELAAALHGQRGQPCAIRRRPMNTSPAAADEPLPCTGERNKMKKSNLCMTCGSRLQVSGLFKKPQQLNQTGFQLSHNSFSKLLFQKSQSTTAFPKVTAQPNTPLR
jgi:hypothetical protein